MRLEKLNEAVEDWDNQVRAFESDQGMVSRATTMAQRARTVNWTGANASVTLPYVTEQAEQFDAALIQARTLRELCHDAYVCLKARQEDLREVIEVQAPAHGVHVRASGEVTADYDGLDDVTRRERQDAVIAISAEIDRILTQVSEDDAIIARALRDAMGTDPHRFSPVEYGSLHEAESAYRDAETALRLMEQGSDLSDEQLAYVATLLGQHADDPAFAERVTTALGPQGTLDFWFGATVSRDIREGTASWQTFADIQTNLGTVLGAATRSDSSAMERWEESMLSLAPNRVGGADGPYGFQVMSALMNAGEYDTDFLLAYGDKLMTCERADDRAAAQLWDSPYLPPFNFPTQRDDEGNLIDSGNIGHDPVIGFLNALGHNPDASTQFFAPPNDFDPTASVDITDADSVRENRDRLNNHLAYLAIEREWWTSVDHQGHPDPRPAHPSLGNALLAATTGHASAELLGGAGETALVTDLRSTHTSAVMEQVVQLYGAHDPRLLDEQPEMAGRLGLMAAAYVDDIDYVISMAGQSAPEVSDSAFVSPYDGRLDNSRRATIEFLDALGHHEESHRVMSQAQHVYTLGNLDAFPPDDQEAFARGERSLRTAAEVRGILDGARISQIEADYGAGTDAARGAEQQAASWWKAGSNALIGIGTGAAAAAVAGSSGPVAVVVPIAASTAGVFLGEFFGQTIDGSAGVEADRGAQDMMTGDLREDTEIQLGDLAGMYEERAAASLDANNLHDDVKNQYWNGVDVSNQYDEQPNEG
ncbi:hypothetical protein E1265_20060 [Streptomyces sp. 8K308]|uniref:DUF6571 family protein n=1 Tax=Streptomyces sp. 8K308 TaxID=2530388 RepID=UPI00104CDB8F|nr:DUF6571 family protein [Streptomyces sp. 8K308]TDC20858.1 hypothetical protein E1265_20060 [Streptomyces sp. 8K308]